MNRYDSKNSVGIGIVGGGLVSYLHALGIRSSSSARITSISSRSNVRARHMGMLLGVANYTFDALDKMFERDDTDLVLIGSPNGTHFEHALAAVNAGKAIVVEKPLTLSLENAAALVKLEQEGAFIGYAENHVFSPVLAELKCQIGKGTIGEIQEFECHFNNPALPRDNWHGSVSLAGGGALVDLGSHLIATCDWLIDEDSLSEVVAAHLQIDPKTGLDLSAEIVMRSDAGIRFKFSVGFGTEPQGCSYRVKGTEGVITAGFMPEPQVLVLERKGHEPEKVLFDFSQQQTLRGMSARNGYMTQIEHFSESLVAGRRPILGAAEGEKTLKLIVACYRSAAGNRPTKYDEDIDKCLAPILHLTM